MSKKVGAMSMFEPSAVMRVPGAMPGPRAKKGMWTSDSYLGGMGGRRGMGGMGGRRSQRGGEGETGGCGGPGGGEGGVYMGCTWGGDNAVC